MADINQRLHDAIKAVCPIDGVAVLDETLHKIRVDYRPEATAADRAAAQAVIDSFDWSALAQKAVDTQGRATALASDPILQFVLKQINKAVPGYTVPDKATIAADQIIVDGAKGK